MAGLLNRLRAEMDGLVTKELREMLRDEQSWLTRAQELVTEVRRSRERNSRDIGRRCGADGPSRLSCARRCCRRRRRLWLGDRAVCLGDSCLRERADFGDSVLRRMARMTPVQRRQFDALFRETGPAGLRP